MIHIEPFEPQHLTMIAPQPMQSVPEQPEFYAAAGPAWTARAEDGHILFCGGFGLIDRGYAHAWCVMTTNKRADLVPITRACQRVIAGSTWRRVEMFTDVRFEAAARWAKTLGFALEGVRRSAMPDGGDMLVWAIIRGND
jgi:hypothetical protein